MDKQEKCEKRAFERFTTDMFVWVRLQEKPEEDFFLLEVANISAGGMLLKMDEPLPESTMLDIRFELPQNNDLVKASAEVKHLHSSEDETFLAGVKFVDVKNYTVSVLMAYLEALHR